MNARIHYNIVTKQLEIENAKTYYKKQKNVQTNKDINKAK